MVWTRQSGESVIPSIRAGWLVVSPDGRSIAGTRWIERSQLNAEDQLEEFVFVLDVATRAVVTEFAASPWDMEFAPDSSSLAIASVEGPMIWTADGELRRIGDSSAFALAFAPEHDDAVAFAVHEAQPQIIVVEAGKITGSIPISAGAFDIALLANDLIVVNLADASPVSSLIGTNATTSAIVHERLLLSNSAQVTADGSAVVAATTEGIAFFDPETLRQISLVNEYGSSVVASEISHNFAIVGEAEDGLELGFFDVLTAASACELAAPYVTVQQVREVMGEDYQMQTCLNLSPE